jgi:hypothetical protein
MHVAFCLNIAMWAKRTSHLSIVGFVLEVINGCAVKSSNNVKPARVCSLELVSVVVVALIHINIIPIARHLSPSVNHQFNLSKKRKLFLRVALLSVSPDIFTDMRVGIGAACW